MKVSICTFFKNGKRLGISPIPEYSDAEVRRAVAKHLGIQQYDEVEIAYYDIDLGAPIHKARRNLIDLANSVTDDRPPIMMRGETEPTPKEQVKAEILQETEPIL